VQDSTLRKLAGAAVCLVAAIAATVSYLHIYSLAVMLGQPALAAWLMPLSVDGAVGAASVALLSAARSGASSPGIARVMLALGVLATLTANAYSGSVMSVRIREEETSSPDSDNCSRHRRYGSGDVAGDRVHTPYGSAL
jgi:hypothetical protein